MISIEIGGDIEEVVVTESLKKSLECKLDLGLIPKEDKEGLEEYLAIFTTLKYYTPHYEHEELIKKYIEEVEFL